MGIYKKKRQTTTADDYKNSKMNYEEICEIKIGYKYCGINYKV